jgi:hypothetical protein
LFAAKSYKKRNGQNKNIPASTRIAKNCCVTTNNPCAKPPRLSSKQKRILDGPVKRASSFGSYLIVSTLLGKSTVHTIPVLHKLMFSQTKNAYFVSST